VRHNKRATIVAIPAKNEADRIGPSLSALALQTRKPDAVLLLLNNCTDNTAAIARTLSARLPYRLQLRTITFPPSVANAGNARRLAMECAAGLAGGDGVLMTTDADAVVAPDWVERNLLAIAAGANVVCGRVMVDAIEAARIPLHLHADDALECELTAVLDRIAARLDPDPADPWPRHTEAAGASLAVTVTAFRHVGGIPAMASGEDRAFIQALARLDARIRHDPTVAVTVSCRTEGRAEGGMADTIRRRIIRQDEFTDASLEPTADAYRRIDFRRRIRLAWRERWAGYPPPVDLAVDLGIPDAEFRAMLNRRFFGTAWANIEASSPFLARRRVRFTELPGQIAYARQLLAEQAVSDAVGS
jgi:glycosyltransferase involved in cell wall biosynthesis